MDFVTVVQPIFAHACYQCHGKNKQKGGLRLDVREIALRGGDDGPAIVPGHSDRSPLIHYIAGDDPDKPMPPKGPMLTLEQVGVIARGSTEAHCGRLMRAARRSRRTEKTIGPTNPSGTRRCPK